MDGAVGSFVSLWDENFFSLESKVVNQRYILLVGTVLLRNIRCGFGNIYVPNDDRERQVFWEELEAVLKSKEDPWCLRVILIQ